MKTRKADIPLYAQGTTINTPGYKHLVYLPPYFAQDIKDAVHHPATAGGQLQAINEAVAYELAQPSLQGWNQCTRTLAIYGIGEDPKTNKKNWYGMITDEPHIVENLLESLNQDGAYKSWVLPKKHRTIQQVIEEVDQTKRIVKLRPTVWQRRYTQTEDKALDSRLTYRAFAGDIEPGNAQFDICLPSIDALIEMEVHEDIVQLTPVSLTHRNTGKYQIDAVKPLGYRNKGGMGRGVVGTTQLAGTRTPEKVDATLHFVGRHKSI